MRVDPAKIRKRLAGNKQDVDRRLVGAIVGIHGLVDEGMNWVLLQWRVPLTVTLWSSNCVVGRRMGVAWQHCGNRVPSVLFWGQEDFQYFVRYEKTRNGWENTRRLVLWANCGLGKRDSTPAMAQEKKAPGL